MRLTVALPSAIPGSPDAIFQSTSGGQAVLSLRLFDLLRRRTRAYFGVLRQIDFRSVVAEGPGDYTHATYLKQYHVGRAYGFEVAAIDESVSRIRDAMSQLLPAIDAALALLDGDVTHRPAKSVEHHPWVDAARSIARDAALAKAGGYMRESVDDRLAELRRGLLDMRVGLLEATRDDAHAGRPIAELREFTDTILRAVTRFAAICQTGAYGELDGSNHLEAVRRDITQHFKAITAAKRRRPRPEE